MSRKIFCTFADSRMKDSLSRIESQAKEMNFFDEIYIEDESGLDVDFREYFKKKLIKGSRGYGYWVWKPQIILQKLRGMNDGDSMLYIDAGCHLNKNGLDRLKYYFTQLDLSEPGLLVFQEGIKSSDLNLQTPNCIDKYYSKGDIFDYFRVREREDIYNTGMIAGGIIFIRKGKKSEDIIKKWLDVFKNNFSLIDDSPSKSPNFEGFIENRHDQSVFSILCKLEKIPSISSGELWQQDWKKLDHYPIHAKRDKKLSLLWKIHRKINGLIARITK